VEIGAILMPLRQHRRQAAGGVSWPPRQAAMARDLEGLDVTLLL
jgi:hypothetical protein